MKKFFHDLFVAVACFFSHDWRFMGGDWVPGLENQCSLWTRQCFRCGLYQEISNMKQYGIQFLEKEERRAPKTPGKYDKGGSYETRIR